MKFPCLWPVAQTTYRGLWLTPPAEHRQDLSPFCPTRSLKDPIFHRSASISLCLNFESRWRIQSDLRKDCVRGFQTITAITEGSNSKAYEAHATYSQGTQTYISCSTRVLPPSFEWRD